MNEGDDDDGSTDEPANDPVTLPPGSPQWMRAAVGKPVAEWPERLRERIGEAEVALHFKLAQDITHCEGDLTKLVAKRAKLKFPDFDAKRAEIERYLDVLRARQEQLVDTPDAERVLALARVLAARKSGTKPADGEALAQPVPNLTDGGARMNSNASTPDALPPPPADVVFESNSGGTQFVGAPLAASAAADDADPAKPSDVKAAVQPVELAPDPPAPTPAEAAQRLPELAAAEAEVPEPARIPDESTPGALPPAEVAPDPPPPVEAQRLPDAPAPPPAEMAVEANNTGAEFVERPLVASADPPPAAVTESVEVAPSAGRKNSHRVRRESIPEIIRNALLAIHDSATDFSMKVDIRKHPLARLQHLLNKVGIETNTTDTSFKRGLKLALNSLPPPER